MTSLNFWHATCNVAWAGSSAGAMGAKACSSPFEGSQAERIDRL